tara:strand:- start:47 stop:520 length:474 start_codon:yes stop_codon:yes gene_type:complete
MSIVINGTNGEITPLATFTGTTSQVGISLVSGIEKVTVSATAATGTINYDVTTQSNLYYTANAAANWTVNFRASSGTSMNTMMAVGDSTTVVHLVTQGGTAYYNNAVQVDGSSVTPDYQGGTAWSGGNINGIDVYVYVIIKTADATFKILASQTQFT